MNKTAKQLLQVLDTALAPDNDKNMKLEFLNAGKANAEIWRLEQQLGLEQGEAIFHIRRCNERVKELRTHLGVKASQPATTPAAKAEPAKEWSAMSIAERKEHQKAYENRSVKELIAKAEAAAVAAATPKPRFDADTLAEMVDGVWGRGKARELCHVPLFITPRADGGDRRHMGTHEQAHDQENRDKELKAAMAAKDQAYEAGRYDKLRAFLFAEGVKVPGLSYAGLRVRAERGQIDPRELEIAQTKINKFVAVLDGSEDSALDRSTIADTARKFMAKRSGQMFGVSTVGQKLE